jgi:2-octaprenyl-6-methoxyphenol hydroxylase
MQADRHGAGKMKITKEIQTDLLIVGGGMAGMTMALAAEHAGLDVVMIERAEPSDVTAAPYDGRVSAIAYGCHAMFDVLGVWPHLEAAEPIQEIRVSDGHSPFFLHFDHREVGDRPFGFMVENRHLRMALHERLAMAERIEFFTACELDHVDRSGGQAKAVLGNGIQVTAPLVIGAEGRFSPLREAAGIRLLKWQYPQTAIVSVVEHEEPHHGVALEHFLPAGPFALLPMAGNQSALVWTEKQDLAPAMVALPDDEFDAEIQHRLGDHWGKVKCVAPRWTYPLGLQNAERYIDQRLALISDAAHAMHPIAGQGLNVGLRDVACLAEVLRDAKQLGLDIGGQNTLRKYQEWRRFDALTMLIMTDGLNRGFSTNFGPVRAARDLGLGLVNRIGPAKRFFERHAAGFEGDLPKLIKGEALV